jgi:outer membrane protein OmpA-like peptidoglycan-associated protein
MKYLLVLLSCCILVLSELLFASTVSNNGTAAADFLNIDAGARPAGMAGAFTAVADETSGMYSNPAGLGFVQSQELQTGYSLWLADIYYGYMGYSRPTKIGSFGLGLQYLSSAGMPKIVNGVASNDFTFADSAASLLYSRKLGETVSLGLNIKAVQSSIDTSALSTATGDLGFMFRTREEGFSFGLSGANLFGTLGDEKLPAAYRAGMAFKLFLPEQATDILFTLEGGRVRGSPDYCSAGIEHWGADILGLRVGYKYLLDDAHRDSFDPLAPWTGGISLRIGSFALDYAYQPFAALGAAQRATLTWRAGGWKKKWRIIKAVLKAEPNIFSPNMAGAKNSVFFVPMAPELMEIRNWELVVEDVSHNEIKKFTGKDVMPKILSWEGQTERGDFVPEGRYFARFTADGSGRKRAVSEYSEIIADLTPPAVSLQLSTTDVALNNTGLNGSVTFYLSVSDMYGIDQWQLNIINDKGKSIKIFKSTASVPVELAWDGKDDYYGSVVAGGDYSVKVTAWDVAGNKSRVTKKLTVAAAPKEIVKEVVVKEVEVKQEKRGLVINLASQVLFSVGKSALKLEASRALEEVVSLLQTYSENEVLIEGHSDSTGSLKKNMELSSGRAWAVYSYLVKKGVAASRLKAKGYGPEKPVATNKTSAGRARNRRVEIIILKKEAPDKLQPAATGQINN